ncbi:FecR domain-containing protein [Sphingomonas sp. BK345]|uniref:FecR family protein n=1 Tax=Sphingomonas sp. BK345 TaxID=2586980 RepID=UPI001612ADE8|nr:FecR domain-containing protein [Sphingomonas sp. BK345]MBB3474139.1 transmembrane sensor [Sphingomonas sp. BK345]
MTDAPTKLLATAADWADRLGELTAAERTALLAWLTEDETHVAAFDAMRRLLGDVALVEATAPMPLAAATVRPPRRRWRREDRPAPRAARWGSRVAVATVLTLALPLGWRVATAPAPAIERHVYASGIGARRQLALPDGSRMTLDAASRVAVAFGGDARALDLSRGAARFKVHHDPARPFTVTTADARVTALGTVFAVDRAAGGSSVRVFRGRVRLEVPGTIPAALAAGGWATVRDGHVRLRRFDPARDHGWDSYWLEADDIRLDVALAQLSRYAPHSIRLADARLAAEPVTGRFRRDAPRRSAAQIGALFDLALVERDGTLWLERRRAGAATR